MRSPRLAERTRRNFPGTPGLLGATAGTLAVSACGQLFLLASGVFGARLLGVTGRGQLALLLLLSSIVTAVGSLGLPLAVTYWTARENGFSHRSRERIVGFGTQQVLIVTGVHAAILVALFASASRPISEAAVMSLLATPGLLVYQYSLAILQGERRFSSFNAQRLALPSLYAFFVVALYVLDVHTLIAVIAAWDAAVILPAISSTVAVRRGPVSSGLADIPPLPEMVRFGMKGLLGSVSPLETFQLDQAIVGLFISPTALGLYVVGVAFTNIPRFIGQAIGLVAYPHLAARADGLHAGKTILRFMAVGFGLCGLAAGLVEIAVPWLVPRLFGQSFAPAVGIARVLLISALLVSLRRLLADCARGAGLPGVGSLAEITALALFPLVLVVVGGDATGVAWSLVLSGAVALAVTALRLGRGMARASGPAGNTTTLPAAHDAVAAESVAPIVPS